MNLRVPSLVAATLFLSILAFLAPPGRGQEGSSARYAFSDTTLLRDTLNLKFDLLFPLADSLQMPAERLRALSVRFRIPLMRMVYLSDSLRLPVDSVGAIMERESFNPLTMSTQRISAFSYNSTYQIQQEGRNTWGNGTEYTMSMGGIQARNVTNVSIDRVRGNLLAITRASETEANYRYSKNLSLGGRVFLQRDEGFDTFGRTVSSNKEYQLTMRSTQQPRRNLRSGFSLFVGPFNEPESQGTAAKRGISSITSGTLNYNHRGWLLYDLTSRLTTKLGRGRLPDQPWLSIREMFGNARGTLALYERAPVSLRFSHDYTRNRAQNPDTLTTFESAEPSTRYFLRGLPSGGSGASLAINLRRGAHGSMTVTGELRRSERLLKVGGISRTGNSTGASLNADGRYTVGGWTLDGHFSDDHPTTNDPSRVTRTGIIPRAGGGQDTTVFLIDYRQRTATHTRSFDLSVDRALSRKISVRAKTRVYVSSPRSSIVDSSYRDLPNIGTNRISATEPRDTYEDGVELTGIYSPTASLSTTVGLDISTRDNINLLSSSSINNTHVRTYQATWSWTYRLMEGLTATQRNQATADYTYRPFASNLDLLAMRFDIRTTLNAVLTPRFRIDLTHGSEEQPRGSYVRGEDGQSFFRVASRTRSYNLSSNISYTPIPSMSLTLTPNYRADATPGNAALQKSLNFSGGASVNLPVGQRGALSGSMARTYTVRSPAAGEIRVPPVYSWSGSLQLSWKLQ